MKSLAVQLRIRRVRAPAFTVPTDRPETNDPLAWTKTTLMLAEAGGEIGLDSSYTCAPAVGLIAGPFAGAVVGFSASDAPRARAPIQRALRNLGRPGFCAAAMSAVDLAL